MHTYILSETQNQIEKSFLIIIARIDCYKKNEKTRKSQYRFNCSQRNFSCLSLFDGSMSKRGLIHQIK